MIDAKTVKTLRERTGVGMMECKRALVESGGDIERAAVWLREHGLAQAQKKEGRAATEGLVDAYIHAGGRIGVLVEVNCETDFVASTEPFRTLVHDIALQVAATSPRWVRREEVPPEVVASERAILTAQVEQDPRQAGKSPAILEKIVEGRLEKFYQTNCLMEQAFVRDPDTTIQNLVRSKVALLGENIAVRRFVRFALGEGSDPAAS